MAIIPRPGKPDLRHFEPGREDIEARYGLPGEVAFCKRCVVSNQRPNSSVEFKNDADTPKETINLDDEGICDACRARHN